MTKNKDDVSQYEKLKKEYEEFAYVVSHDLCAPIREINGFTTMLLNELNADLTENQSMYRDVINEAVKKTELFLDALLEFSRLSTDELRIEEINTQKLLEEAIAELQEQISESKADVSTSQLPESITGDRKALLNAFYHLIDNAIKFQPDDQKPEIQITADKNDTTITFCIKDNGIGMKEDKVDDAFIILRRLNRSDAYPGRGAGLTLAKKIAEIHGGTISIKSKENEGTEVYFSIKDQLV